MADITLLSTADWDQLLWTNKQHVASELASLGHRVLYVESLGLRAPRQQAQDFRRIGRRLLRSLRPPRLVRPNLWVWSPLVLPGVRGALARQINRLLLLLGLASSRRCLKLRPDWLWTYNPKTIAYGLPHPYRTLIYHCVDEIQAQPDMDAADLSFWEEQLCRAADLVFVTSPALLESRIQYNQNTHFFPNVADHSHFASALDPGLAIPDDLVAIPMPRIGFVGAISGYKLDLDLLAELADQTPEWSYVMIGPVGEGDPGTDLSRLRCCRNVYWLGAKPYPILPAYMKGLDVGLLPLRFNRYTHSMFPMKFFEYLGAGLPVVASAIDSLRDYRTCALLCEPTVSTFRQALQSCLDGKGPDLQLRLDTAAQHTYHGRTLAMLSILATGMRQQGWILP
ncbi:glycosyltransferase [Synechococcus sp. CS-1324]|nr:glycosyltransferase [Synechococcus sp. CS-1324]PZV05307.1 MAG: glycosyltransferase family 1 protein [Cyanobium sp.]